MGAVMRLDVVPFRYFGVASGVALLVIIISIIIGATGPPVHDSKVLYAYDCPGESHVWQPQCGGVQLVNNNTYWEFTLPKQGLLNRFWLLEVLPFNTLNQAVSTNLDVRVTLLAKTSPFSETWLILNENDTHTEGVQCPQGPAECSQFLLIYEEFINYPIYRVMISLPTPSNRNFVGDVRFKFSFGHAGFSTLEIAFRLFLLATGLILMSYYLWTMHFISVAEWSWEQRSIALLLVSLICFNNPFYPLTFAVHGWFFPVLASLLEVAFFCITVLFWLLMVDKLRRDELRVEFSLYHLPKLIAVAIFGILCLVLFAWISIRDETDPIYSTKVTGVQVLFYLVAVIWTGLIVWVAVEVARTLPVVSKKSYLLTRFLFFAVPTGIVIVSIMIGVLVGNFGPLRRSTLSFMYFIMLFNVYVFFLTWGYWPVKEGFVDKNPSEATRLTFASADY